jgi:hypothetical protein
MRVLDTCTLSNRGQSIHTDIAVARPAGLPGIILHGTATLALAVSYVLRHASVDPRAVRRISGRFTGMVPYLPASPSTSHRLRAMEPSVSTSPEMTR